MTNVFLFPPPSLQVQRGRTYSHERNGRVNLLLTGAVVLVLALVLGLGVGHFLGWSERLELQVGLEGECLVLPFLLVVFLVTFCILIFIFIASKQ